MNIAVIGTGNVGRVLGRRWSASGHAVYFGSRDPEDDEVRSLAKAAGARVGTRREAADSADIVVLAVPGSAVTGVVASLGALEGKIIIDCTNRHRKDLTPKPTVVSLAEEIAEAAPGARVVKAFNTTGAKNMADPRYPDGTLPMFYCGDDEEAKKTVAGLISELGFEPVDNGPLHQAFALEGMALVWIGQAYGQGWGPNFGFSYLKR